MKIDSHVHLWQFDPVREAWILPTMGVIRRDFLPADLTATLTAAGISGCVLVQTDQSEEATVQLIDWAAGQPLIRGVVGWVDLRAGNLPDRLEHYGRHGIVRGFRHLLQSEDEAFMLLPDFQRGIETLARYNYPYDLLIYPNQLPPARELASRVPQQRFVVNHLAKPYIKSHQIELWEKDIRLLAQHDNVWCKLSGMATEADWLHWQETDLRPYLDAVLEAFGTHRVMFGSDWPVMLLAAEYPRWLKALETYLQGFTDNEKAMIWGGNATDFYGLS